MVDEAQEACMTLSKSRQSATRWCIDKGGSISWIIAGKAHQDRIEMSGRKVSVIVTYGADESGKPQLRNLIVWPMLRTIPNDTYGSLSEEFGTDAFPSIKLDGKPMQAEKLRACRLSGLLVVDSTVSPGFQLTRTLFPSTRAPVVIEHCTLTNATEQTHRVEIGTMNDIRKTDPAKGVCGEYILEARGFGSGSIKLQPGESANFGVVFSGRKSTDEPLEVDCSLEQRAREGYVDDLLGKLCFECPDSVVEREFAFCKIRAAESIFETQNGLMHGPGGGTYYAAIWANDQAEYANPFFPFLGDFSCIESALNSFRQFSRFVNPDYKPIPSSIIAEGTDIWNGKGDRGDAAMIAYGASRYALARGDRRSAEELWPLIGWCLEYCRRKTNVQGVVESDCDELEGRFPAGDANLCTSSLYYDALLSAGFLARDLGKPDSFVDQLDARARKLRQDIESHFGATVEGFKTYRYYDGNTVLRAWIGIPLAMGIFDRREGTIGALFSPMLWSVDGLLTEAGKDTFWDRSTLYALRGAFAAGEGEQALTHLIAYSRRRLLGDHVPYPVEEGPQGAQNQLSAESALYCRVITEGLFGIRPEGLRKFRLTPFLPKGWDHMSLQKVYGFGNVFDIEVTRRNGSPALRIKCERGEAMVREDGGGTFSVSFPE
jgi:hypothetical protein